MIEQLERDDDWFIKAALDDIQTALDLINLPLKEQERAYNIIDALDETRERLRSAKSLLREVVGWKQ